jgi:hypothetical protein
MQVWQSGTLGTNIGHFGPDLGWGSVARPGLLWPFGLDRWLPNGGMAPRLREGWYEEGVAQPCT